MKLRTTEPTTSSEKRHHLIRRLGSPDSEERRIAQEEFMRMATDDPALFHADLADIIKAITGNRKRTSIGIGIGIGLFYLAYMLVFFLMGIMASVPPGMEAILWFLGTIAVLTPIALTGVGIFRMNVVRRRKRLAECIKDIDDLNALPALIELLEFSNPTVQKAITPPVTRLLSRLRASDAYLLGFLHRTALARTLNTPRTRKLPPAFFVAVLEAFEQIGDSQVLPTVAWLAQGKGAGGDHPPIQEAAKACQAHLEEQLRRHQAPYLLLRPSSLAEAPQNLLRPVASAPDSAPHELLRADNSQSYEQLIATDYNPPTVAPDPLPIQLQRYEEP